ncbi:hypothetical protein [Motiliproteus sediminis]|uniref:hypothetical protein n=1 Tax=Motiliproteus sediminis TaxID=1468178 RepID=UPI001AF0106F|nr:hypothetical protein [Motiliproteus sediminis]
MLIPSPDDRCSKHFHYRDFLFCGETQNRLDLPNTPTDPQTYEAIKALACEILDKVVDEFGDIELTFAFCSAELAKKIRKNPRPRIAPERDQHAGYEQNSCGKQICNRGGFAADFRHPSVPSDQLAHWVIGKCAFDRLYYYGSSHPLHVSTGPNHSRTVVLMQERDGRRVPRVIKEDQFNTLINADGL